MWRSPRSKGGGTVLRVLGSGPAPYRQTQVSRIVDVVTAITEVNIPLVRCGFSLRASGGRHALFQPVEGAEERLDADRVEVCAGASQQFVSPLVHGDGWLVVAP